MLDSSKLQLLVNESLDFTQLAIISPYLLSQPRELDTIYDISLVRSQCHAREYQISLHSVHSDLITVLESKHSLSLRRLSLSFCEICIDVQTVRQ